MRNVGIYRTHLAIQKNMQREGMMKKLLEGENKCIKRAKTSKQKAFGPS